MSDYRITTGQQFHDGSDASPYWSFRVTDGERVAAYAACVSGYTMAAGVFKGCDWPITLSIALLGEIEDRLRAGALHLNAGLHKLEYTDEDGLLREVAKGPKVCEWQQPSKTRGKLCSATRGKPEPTTGPLCATCDMPDCRLACSALVHPVTKLELGVCAYIDGPITSDPSRTIEQAFCDVHLQQDDWASCRPWAGKDCWHRIVKTGTSAPAPDAGAPRRLVDEIGYLRLVYADRFALSKKAGATFWPKSDETAVSTLGDDCHSLSELRTHVTAPCEMLLSMRPHDQLTERRRLGDDDRPVNGITALGRVLEDRFGGMASHSTLSLRALNTARNCFSHTESQELVGALRQLGVTRYPPRDWQVAWWQVAATIAAALAEIRKSIQTSPPSDM